MLFELMEDHPEHLLILPDRGDDYCARLAQIDLSPTNLLAYRLKWESKFPRLWDGNLLDLDEADLRGAILGGATLEEVRLTSANLQGAYLYKVNLRKAVLWNINLMGAELYLSDLQDADLSGANLQDASLVGANLQNARFDDANLQKANLSWANLAGAYLGKANLQGVNLQGAKLQNVDLSSVVSLVNVHFTDAWLDGTRIKRELLGGRVAEEDDKDYKNAREAYRNLKQNFDDLGDYDSASWAYRKERRMRKLESLDEGRAAFKQRKWGKAGLNCRNAIGDTMVEILCDYGESVWRVIGWLVILLFFIEPILFSVLGGFIWDNSLERDYFALLSSWNRFWFSYRLYLLYSLSGLSITNFSGLQPANDAVKLASGLFSISGIFLVGLLGFVAGNRIRRS